MTQENNSKFWLQNAQDNTKMEKHATVSQQLDEWMIEWMNEQRHQMN